MKISDIFKDIFKIEKMTVNITVSNDYCPKCGEEGGIFLYRNIPPFYLCENCNKISTIEEFEHFKNRKQRKDKLKKILWNQNKL